LRLGISSLSFELRDKIYMCKSEGLNHIELGIDNLGEYEILYDYINEIKKHDISIGIHLPMELNTCENIDYIRNAWVDFVYNNLEYAHKLNVKYFNIHLGYVMTNRLLSNRPKYLNNSVDFINEICLKSEEVDIYIENTYSKDGDFSNVGNCSYDFEYIFNKLNNIDKLGFCYDTGHNLIDKDIYTRNLYNKIKLIHLSDNDGLNDLHIGLNHGILDIDEVSNVINIKGLKYIVLEVKDKYISESRDLIKNMIRL
jgi:sugar phosphate isomerase/epimerase